MSEEQRRAKASENHGDSEGLRANMPDSGLSGAELAELAELFADGLDGYALVNRASIRKLLALAGGLTALRSGVAPGSCGPVGDANGALRSDCEACGHPSWTHHPGHPTCSMCECPTVALEPSDDVLDAMTGTPPDGEAVDTGLAVRCYLCGVPKDISELSEDPDGVLLCVPCIVDAAREARES